MRKFSLTANGDSYTLRSHYLIEAPDREQAQRIVEEEGLGPNLTWSAYTSLEWKRAWRRGEVKTLTATRIPKGIE